MSLPNLLLDEDKNFDESTSQNQSVNLKLRINPTTNTTTRATQTASNFDVGRETEGKNIIICFDGTKKDYDTMPYPYSNVLRLVNILEIDSAKQVCYYQPGFVKPVPEHDRQSCLYYGSRFLRDIKWWFRSHFTSITKKYVLLAYKYLMRTYRSGYNIYFFGFSQGALIARILAAMIEKVGLLSHGLEEMIPYAWNIYLSWELAGQPSMKSKTGYLTAQFKLLFSDHNINLCFMGLWDSTNETHSFWDTAFPFSPRNDQVKYIRHALSIDERRASFKPGTFHSSNEKYNIHHQAEEIDDPNRVHSDIVEMWFPGDHADIGGGWLKDCDGEYLAFIPGRWIIGEAYKFGVIYKMDKIKNNLESWSSNSLLLARDHDYLSFKSSRLNKCQTLENDGALIRDNINATSNDQCDDRPGLVYKEDSFAGHGNKSMLRTIGWWLLEILPIPYRIENVKRRWVKTYKPNFGRRRNISSNANIHWSVKWRMKLVNSYNPKNLPSSFDNRIEEDDTIPDDFKDFWKIYDS